MSTATINRTSEQWKIEKKIESTFTKMEWLYAYARILRSELDLSKWNYTTHTSASSLIHELEH